MGLENMGIPEGEIDKDIQKAVEEANNLSTQIDRENAIKQIQEFLRSKEGIERLREKGLFSELPVTDDVSEMADPENGTSVGHQYDYGAEYPVSDLLRAIAISEDQDKVAKEWVDEGVAGVGNVWITIKDVEKNKENIWKVLMGGVFNGGSQFMYGEALDTLRSKIQEIQHRKS